MDVQKEF